MKHREETFKGVRDLSVYSQSWQPEEDIRAVLMLVHGLAEHSGRYANLVDHLVPKGYAVFGLDHIGHGKSHGPPVHVNRFSDYTDTLKIFFERIQTQVPGKPVFLVGHSLGGLIGAAYLLDHQVELAGAVLSGPAVKTPADVSAFTVFVGKLLSALVPGSGLVALEADGVSRDPAVVEAYINDPLVYRGKITARLAAEMVKTMQRVTDEAHRIRLPILILQGSEDRLVDPEGARMLHGAVSSADKTLNVYDGLYHEVFNEPEHAQVLGDVEKWLAGHCPDTP